MSEKKLVVSTFSCNDLASHTHSQYASTDHTHSNYVTSDQVSTIVNENIQSGTIEVKSSMFKSITTYQIIGNTTGVTIQGPGIVTVMGASYKTKSVSSGTISILGYGALEIDGIELRQTGGNAYLFKSSCKLYSSGSSDDYYIKATVGIFN